MHRIDEHLFTLQQNLELFDIYQRQLTACDVAVEAHLGHSVTLRQVAFVLALHFALPKSAWIDGRGRLEGLGSGGTETASSESGFTAIRPVLSAVEGRTRRGFPRPDRMAATRLCVARHPRRPRPAIQVVFGIYRKGSGALCSAICSSNHFWNSSAV